MCPEISVSEDVYKRLESLAVGFDTPSSVIKRLLDHYGDEPIFVKNDDGSESKPSHHLVGKPQLVFTPSDEAIFQQELIRTEKALVVLHKANGDQKKTIWNASRMRSDSHLRGNIFSGFLRGWKEKQIVRAEFTIIE